MERIEKEEEDVKDEEKKRKIQEMVDHVLHRCWMRVGFAEL